MGDLAIWGPGMELRLHARQVPHLPYRAPEDPRFQQDRGVCENLTLGQARAG